MNKLWIKTQKNLAEWFLKTSMPNEMYNFFWKPIESSLDFQIEFIENSEKFIANLRRSFEGSAGKERVGEGGKGEIDLGMKARFKNYNEPVSKINWECDDTGCSFNKNSICKFRGYCSKSTQ
ncbi:hypothetical protein DRP07_06145 [Archaeoglobales archaeon]|nr:MAG: hypothetical protein DRP07_06145 [Archaeoglobales archaeon]